MLLEVGKIDKPHGVRGEVIVSLSTNRTERVAVGTVLRTKAGRALEITASRPHQHRWIVQFDGLTSRSDADALHGALLFAEPLDDPDALWIHELIGCDVVDTTGRPVGRVEAVEENPASDLLVLASGALIPLRFGVEREPGRLVVDVPAGLLDEVD